MAPGMVIIGAGECGARAALALRERAMPAPSPWSAMSPMRLTSARRFPRTRSPPPIRGRRPSPIPTAWPRRGSASCGGRRAIAIDPSARGVTLEDGTRLAYERLLLATDARSRGLSVPGADGPNALAAPETSLKRLLAA
jgi:3-phenylpropionate/trans-cinnamate dioxygenase ferredoxin reductase component